MLGEFGLKDKSTRNPIYKQWTDTAMSVGGAGALYWMLAGKQDDGTPYPDYDGFTVDCPSPVCSAVSHFAAMMTANRSLSFPPVADDDTAGTSSGVAVTLNPPANDVAYHCAAVVPGSLDLDPTTPGLQTMLVQPGGTFVANGSGTVTFTPASGFAGTARASYVISDAAGRNSNAAVLTVTVKGAVLPLESFESGTNGWAFGSWQTGAGSVQQTTAFATDGSFGLGIDSLSGGWLGIQYGTAIDLTGNHHILADVETLGAGTSTNIAVQTGSAWTWCQGAWSYVNPNTIATIDLDLNHLDCGTGTADLSQIHTLFVFFSRPGTYYLDNVRAQP